MPFQNAMKMFRQSVTNGVINVVNRELQSIASDARSNAAGLSSRVGDTEETAPIADAIFVVPAQMMDGKIVGSIAVDLNIAPAARAWEYGSGEWAEDASGDDNRYPISPRNKPRMIFEWYPPLGDITIGGLPWLVNYGDGGGVVAFSTTILHPGIRPNPYLRPAVEKHSEGLKGKILQLVKTEIGTMFVEAVEG